MIWWWYPLATLARYRLWPSKLDDPLSRSSSHGSMSTVNTSGRPSPVRSAMSAPIDERLVTGIAPSSTSSKVPSPRLR